MGSDSSELLPSPPPSYWQVAAKLEGQAAFDALDREERLRIFEVCQALNPEP
jgi:hypothetical protein